MDWQLTPYTIPILVSAGISLAVLVPVIRNRDQQAVPLLLSFLLGTISWSVATLLQLSSTTLAGKLFWSNVDFVGVAVTTLSTLLLGALITDRRQWLAPRRVAPLVAIEAAFGVLLWTNPFHGLMHTERRLVTVDSYTLLDTVFGPLFYLNTGFHYLVLAVTTYWLVSEYWQIRQSPNELYARQLGLMVLAVVVPWAVSIASVVGLLQVDLTPVGFSVTGLLLAVALFRYRLLDILPIARGTVVEQMDNGVVVLDSDDRIVDVNARAQELVGNDDPVGIPFERAFADHPEITERFADAGATSEQISLTRDGLACHYEVTVSPITDSLHNDIGRTIVFNDITEQVERERQLREREQELDLMRQVFSRVLRHNIRNELQIVKTNNELLAADLTGDHREMAESAVAVVDDLVSLSNKARMVEQLVEQDQTPRPVDLGETLQGIVDTYRREFPAVAFSIECEGASAIEVVPAIDLLFENLIENAAEHNTAADPRVGVTLRYDDATAVVTIRDNGPGVPQQELAVIEEGEETDLEHGSGLGLWVVDWVLTNSAATVEYDTGPDGTTVVVRIPTV